jgi:hypothetical protein
MNPVIGQCPICRQNLHVTRLHCRHCDTSLEGHFSLGRLYQLSQEQHQFLETIVCCEGKITREEQETGMTSPAIRSRLPEATRALGYEEGETTEKGISPEERQDILTRIARGELSADEGIDLLRGE